MSSSKQQANSNGGEQVTYKGYVAGVFSGMTKLAVGHPFDTIKVRLQTTTSAQFQGPLDCLLQTVRKEGPLALYKGAGPPLVGWMFMDSLLLGSLTNYRRLLREHVFAPRLPSGRADPTYSLSTLGHGTAGLLAGWTVSFIASPFEHIKARLQIQYGAARHERLYAGPLDCTAQIVRRHGLVGLYRGLGSTLLFRSFFFAWWSTYHVFSEAMRRHTSLTEPVVNFWAGGLSAQVFWITSYPSDVVKQRIMTDGFGADRKFRNWWAAASSVYRESGWRGFWRGFVPCFLRAFPANGMALLAFEGVMRTLGE